MNRSCFFLLLFVLAALLGSVPAFADTVSIDEFTGSCNPFLGCTASLQFAPVTGQVLLNDIGVVLDVITFDNASSSYTFASDTQFKFDLFDSPADTFGPPAPLTNQITLQEPVNEGGVEQLIYTPTKGQPGYALDANGHAVSYSITSDGPPPSTVPEPSSLMLLLPGIFFLARRIRA